MKYAIREKASREDVEDRLHEICIEDIGEEYRILWSMDDGGTHITVAFEGVCPPLAKELIQAPFMGWRLVKLIVPVGYLEVFHPLNKKD